MADIRAAMIETLGTTPTVCQIDPPQAGQGEVLVRMRAAALNFADLLKAQGRYQEPGVVPFIAGLEGAGEVITAPTESGLHPGNRVAVMAPGTLADVIAVPTGACLPIPDTMSFSEAAGFQIAYGTSHLALTDPGRLQAGQRLAVLGAAGGVGLTAVQIGLALGAEVIAVARGSDKVGFLRQQGVTHIIDSDTCTDLRVALREFGGMDVVYDPVGADQGLAAFGALQHGGRFLVIGFAGGGPAPLPLNHALVKNIQIHGFYWGGWRKKRPDLVRTSLLKALDLHADGKLHPHIGETLSLGQLSEGYEMLRTRKAVGKIIVSM